MVLFIHEKVGNYKELEQCKKNYCDYDLIGINYV